MRIITESSDSTKKVSKIDILKELDDRADAFRNGITKAMQHRDFDIAAQQAKTAREYFEKKREEFDKDYDSIKMVKKETIKTATREGSRLFKSVKRTRKSTEKMMEDYNNANNKGSQRIAGMTMDHLKKLNSNYKGDELAKRQLKVLKAGSKMREDIYSKNEKIAKRELKKYRKDNVDSVVRCIGHTIPYVALMKIVGRIPERIDKYISEFSELESTCNISDIKDKVMENKINAQLVSSQKKNK